VSLRAAKTCETVQKFIHSHSGNFGGESHNDRARIPFPLDIACATVLLIELRITPPHALLEHALRANKLPADLARIARLDYRNAAVEAVVATLFIGIDQYTQIDDWDQIKVRKPV